MDAGCAFCGRFVVEGRLVFCEDSQATRTVCSSCDEDVAADADGFRLVA
jgi:hypothetical protein